MFQSLSVVNPDECKEARCIVVADGSKGACAMVTACMLPLIIVAKVETNPPERLIQPFSVDLCMKESFGAVCGAGRRRQRGEGKMP